MNQQDIIDLWNAGLIEKDEARRMLSKRGIITTAESYNGDNFLGVCSHLFGQKNGPIFVDALRRELTK